jgi:hypothetical protein
MRALVIIILLACGLYFFYPELIDQIPLIGSSYGVSKQDPLGTPKKVDAALISSGFVLEQGDPGKPGEATYSHPGDLKRFTKDFPSSVKLKIGEDDYLYFVGAAFVTTQHGYSPQRLSAAERFMSSFWKKVCGAPPAY